MRRTHALILVVVALASSGAAASGRSALANPVDPLIVETDQVVERAAEARTETRSEEFAPGPLAPPVEQMGPPMPVAAQGETVAKSAPAEVVGIEQVAQQADSDVKGVPLGLPRGAVRAQTDAEAPAQNDASSGWILRTAGSLVLVVGLIYVCRWAMQWLEKRTGGGSGFAVTAGAPSGLVQVLARYPVSKGTKLLLLKINARILVVAQTSDGLQTLSEIVDPEEVASILIKTRDEEGASEASRFTDLLREMEADPAVAGAAGDFRSPRRALASSGAEIDGVETAREPIDGASALRNRLSSLGDLSA